MPEFERKPDVKTASGARGSTGRPRCAIKLRGSMKRALQTTVTVPVIMMVCAASAQAQPLPSAKGIIAEHCIVCHRVPGFAEEARNPSIVAPDFQTIADNRKTYTSKRLADFLRRPHFPMGRFTLSEGDIQRIIAFIRGLKSGPRSVD